MPGTSVWLVTPIAPRVWPGFPVVWGSRRGTIPWEAKRGEPGTSSATRTGPSTYSSVPLAASSVPGTSDVHKTSTLVGACKQWIVPQIFKLLPNRHIFFDLVIRFITNRKYAFFCVFYVRKSADNIILIYWIKIDHVQL